MGKTASLTESDCSAYDFKLFAQDVRNGFKPTSAIYPIKDGSMLFCTQKGKLDQSNDDSQHKGLKVKSNLVYPYSTIGRISFQDGEKNNNFGSGFLIYYNLVLTAAHNIYNLRESQFYSNILFFMGVKGQCREEYKIKKMHFPNEYLEGNYNYDFALLELQESAGEKYGFLGMDFKGEDIKGEDLAHPQIAGYPLIQDKESRAYTGKIIYSGSGKVSKQKQQSFIIQHQIPTMKGQSGSPIFIKKKGQYFAIGIHLRRVLDSDSGKGILLNAELKKKINFWFPIKGGNLKLGKCLLTKPTKKKI